jgi:glycosyltransferase 2 family protein
MMNLRNIQLKAKHSLVQKEEYMKDRYWKIFRKLIPFIGIALFIYLISSIGATNIYNALKEIKITYFVLATLLTAPRFLLLGYKWYFICKKQKIGVDFFYVLKLIFVNFIYSVTTPGGLGYHMRIFHIQKKSKESFGKCFANSMIDIWAHTIPLGFLSVLGCFFLFNIFVGELSIIPIAIIAYFLFSLLIIIVLMKKKTGSNIGRFFIKLIIPKRYKQNFGKTIDDIYEDIPRIRDLGFPFLLEILAWLIVAFQVYLLSLSFNINIGFDTFLWVYMISATASMALPISIGGLGVREGVFITIFKILGVAESTSMAISLGGLVVRTVIPTFIGIILSLQFLKRKEK